MLYQYSASNPRRPPAWRWLRAAGLAEAGAQPRRGRDDPWTIRAAKFARAWAACRDPEDQLDLAERQPSLFWAHNVYTDGQSRAPGQPTPFRSELEARILAKQLPQEIADRFGSPVGMIEAYARLFYDLPEPLTETYVTHCLTSHDLATAMAGGKVDALWKWLAYYFGVPMLDSVTRGVSRADRLTSESQVPAAFADLAREALVRRAALATIAFPLNAMNAADFIGHFMKMQSEERAGSAGVDETQAKTLELTMEMLRVRAAPPEARAGGPRYSGAVLPAPAQLDRAAGVEPTPPGGGSYEEYAYPPASPGGEATKDG